MSGNPLEDDPARDQRTREVAYQLWEADGKPHGRDVEFWDRARLLVGMEESRGAGQVEVPAPDDPSVMAGQPVEEASIQDNLGEIPGRMTDQGDRTQTPGQNTTHAAGHSAKPLAPVGAPAGATPSTTGASAAGAKGDSGPGKPGSGPAGAAPASTTRPPPRKRT